MVKAKHSKSNATTRAAKGTVRKVTDSIHPKLKALQQNYESSDDEEKQSEHTLLAPLENYTRVRFIDDQTRQPNGLVGWIVREKHLYLGKRHGGKQYMYKFIDDTCRVMSGLLPNVNFEKDPSFPVNPPAGKWSNSNPPLINHFRGDKAPQLTASGFRPSTFMDKNQGPDKKVLIHSDFVGIEYGMKPEHFLVKTNTTNSATDSDTASSFDYENADPENWPECVLLHCPYYATTGLKKDMANTKGCGGKLLYEDSVRLATRCGHKVEVTKQVKSGYVNGGRVSTYCLRCNVGVCPNICCWNRHVAHPRVKN